MNNIVLIGGGGHCKSVIDVIEQDGQFNIEGILDRIKIPKSLSEIGVPEDCAGRIAEKAMKDQAFATNPKIASLAEVKEMTLASIKKAR